ncbi:MAG: mercury methylation ferredoxin HgcB [Spirochaetes bacterium]|nr:mercury methylation ferredoxin HgcB [Spirochaetota bacterium]
MKLLTRFRYLSGVTSLRFSSESCISCGRCIEVCPHAVFGRNNGRVVLRDPDACMECGACAKNCPVSAIQVRAGVGCAYAILASTWFNKLPWRRNTLESATCCVSPEILSPPSPGSSLVEQADQDSPCCVPAQKPTRNTPCCGGGGCCGS